MLRFVKKTVIICNNTKNKYILEFSKFETKCTIVVASSTYKPYLVMACCKSSKCLSVEVNQVSVRSVDY